MNLPLVFCCKHWWCKCSLQFVLIGVVPSLWNHLINQTFHKPQPKIQGNDQHIGLLSNPSENDQDVKNSIEIQIQVFIFLKKVRHSKYCRQTRVENFEVFTILNQWFTKFNSHMTVTSSTQNISFGPNTLTTDVNKYYPKRNQVIMWFQLVNNRATLQIRQ